MNKQVCTLKLPVGHVFCWYESLVTERKTDEHWNSFDLFLRSSYTNPPQDGGHTVWLTLTVNTQGLQWIPIPLPSQSSCMITTDINLRKTSVKKSVTVKVLFVVAVFFPFFFFFKVICSLVKHRNWAKKYPESSYSHTNTHWWQRL